MNFGENVLLNGLKSPETHGLRFKRGIQLFSTLGRVPDVLQNSKSCLVVLFHLVTWIELQLNYGYSKWNPLHPRLW